MSQQTPLEYWLSKEGQTILREAAAYLSSTKTTPYEPQHFCEKQHSVKPRLPLKPLKSRFVGKRRVFFGEWAEEGFFTRQSLEQATTPTVANHHAEKFRTCHHVLEICTGAGFDTATLAKYAKCVSTIEANERLAAMARHNLRCRVSRMSRFFAAWRKKSAQALI